MLGGRRRRGRCAPGEPPRHGGQRTRAPLASGPALFGALGSALCPALSVSSSQPSALRGSGAMPSLPSSPGRGVRATLPERGSSRGTHRTAARGSSAAASGPTRGSGRPSARRARTAPARRRSAVQHRRGGQRRRPLSRLAGPGAPPRRDKAAAGRRRARRSAGGDPWLASLAALGHGGEGEVRRAGPPHALPHAAPWSVQPEGDQRCLWG